MKLITQETFRVAHCAGLDSSDEDDAAESDESTPALALPFQLHSYVLVANIPGVSELVVDFPALIGILSRYIYVPEPFESCRPGPPAPFPIRYRV
jgi:hypothetical protein